MRKILILGSNSYSGNYLSDYLLNRKFKVVGVSLSNESPDKFNKISTTTKKLKKNFFFYKVDINKNFNLLKKIISSHNPETIIDFLGQGMVAESWVYPELTFNTNVISKIKLYEFLKNKKFLRKYIKISTPEVFGSSKIKSSKFENYNPSTPYALSHMVMEKYLNLMKKQYSFPIILSRFANFYGPYQKLYRIIPLAIHKAYNKEKFLLHGGGLSKRSFIYSEDFCNGILKMIKSGMPGDIYQFSSKEYVSIKEVVEYIYKKHGLNPKEYIKKVTDRPGKDLDYKINDDDTRKKLKWKNYHTLKNGIEETINWYKSYQKMFNKKDEKFKIK